MKQPTILILPGWQNSGPEHWQSFWLKKYSNAVKVEQKDWMYAKKEEWVKTLNEYIKKYYASMERSEYFAKCWGSQIVNIGPHGHINSASGLGEWGKG